MNDELLRELIGEMRGMRADIREFGNRLIRVEEWRDSLETTRLSRSQHYQTWLLAAAALIGGGVGSVISHFWH